MVFIVVALVICSTRNVESVKVVIDGTIDLAPNWNNEFKKLKPNVSFEPRRRVSSTLKVPTNSEDDHAKGDVKINQDKLEVNTERIEKANKIENNTEIVETKLEKTLRIEKEDNDETEENVSEDGPTAVTSLFKPVSKNEAMLQTPREIKDVTKIVEFIKHIYNTSIELFDKIGATLEEDISLKQTFLDLKARFEDRFGQFVDETKHHIIKTTLGTKKVIINTIDHCIDQLNRLINRLRLETVEIELRNRGKVFKKLKKVVDKFKTKCYESACRTFGICRAGKEFSDHIEELLTIYIKADDTKLQSFVEAIIKELKNADYSRIMDTKTSKNVIDILSDIEEHESSELRFILMGYILMIQIRNQPIVNAPRDEGDTAKILALYYVIEAFDKNLRIDNKYWKNIKKRSETWVAGKGDSVKETVKDFIEHVNKGVARFDKDTTDDIKAKLKIVIGS